MAISSPVGVAASLATCVTGLLRAARWAFFRASMRVAAAESAPPLAESVCGSDMVGNHWSGIARYLAQGWLDASLLGSYERSVPQSSLVCGAVHTEPRPAAPGKCKSAQE